jgi:hypothetical protein
MNEGPDASENEDPEAQLDRFNLIGRVGGDALIDAVNVLQNDAAAAKEKEKCASICKFRAE